MASLTKKLSGLFGAKDMTTGKPVTNLIEFSIPLLIGNLAQQLYNTVDSIVVGKYIGDTALAAVGASGPLLNLLLVLFVGVSTGASILASQYFGAKDKKMVSKTVGNTIVLAVIVALTITVLGLILTRSFMTMLGTPEDIFEMSCTYLNIIFIGMLGNVFYNIMSGILRGLGDSVVPLMFLLVACGVNIVLDLLFVAVFQWGVAGVAWATIIAQAISAICCVYRILRMHDVLIIDREALKLDGKLCSTLIKLGLPSGVTQAIFSMATLIVQSLTNSFGSTVIACNVIVMRVDGFAMMPNFSFGMAMTTFVGQNVGARRMDRVEKGIKDGMKLGLTVSVVLVGAILLFGKYLMAMFTSTPEVIDLSMRMMRTVALGYVAMAVTQILSGAMRGAGDTVTPMWISIVNTVIVRAPLAYLLVGLSRTPENPVGEPLMLFISLLVAWLVGAALTFIMYLKGGWKNKAYNTIESKADIADKAE